MNKNDLRYVKTEELILNTYLDLVRSHQRNITVTLLCKTARINSSTFYTHYSDMEALHKAVCQKQIQLILKEEPGLMTLHQNPAEFVNTIHRVIIHNNKFLELLFRNEKNFMLDLIEAELMKLYITDATPKEMETKIAFCVGGSMRILCGGNSTEKIDDVIALIKQILVVNIHMGS